MANTLTDYRADLDNLLATAVDSSTWTSVIKDQALRMAIDELNSQLVYETSFTVTIAGYEQDLSAVAGLNNLLAVAYPWTAGLDFAHYQIDWRFSGVNKIYITGISPQVGEIIRLRHTKLHTIQTLDAAATTTVPDRDRSLVGLWAAAYCCDLRIRQISENPALPAEAAPTLRQTAQGFRSRAAGRTAYVPPLALPNWGNIGL